MKLKHSILLIAILAPFTASEQTCYIEGACKFGVILNGTQVKAKHAKECLNW